MKTQSVLLMYLAFATAGSAQARHFFVSIPPQGQAKYQEANYALWLPEGAGKLRAVILHQHGCGEPAETAGATATFDLQWQALAKKWDCALMGANYRQSTTCSDWCDPENGTEAAFLEALEQFARQSGRVELTQVPWVLWGHSGGAGWAYQMFTRHSDRVLAVVLRSGPTSRGPVFTDSPGTPVLYNLGRREKNDARFGRIWARAGEVFQARRSRNALDTWSPDPQSSHDCRFGRLLVIPYLDACLAQRLGTPGTGLMASIDMAPAWFGNIETFEICPAGEYRGELDRVAWLPNERIARFWQEFVRTGWVTDRTPPPAPTGLKAAVAGPGRVALQWQAEADPESGIKTFRLYRDGRPLPPYSGPDKDGKATDLFQKPNYHDTLDQPLQETAYTDTDVKPGATYRYEVAAVNWSDLESGKSGPATVKTAADP
jgi:pimeloyl-ACP methyl ester carboxylesterase